MKKPASGPRLGRGRPPKGEYSGKTSALMTRITPQLRNALEDAANRNGRSLSQEAERRLRQSFDPLLEQDRVDTFVNSFGGNQNFAVFRIIVQAQECVEFITRRKWIDDRFTFEQILLAINVVFATFRPPGKLELPPEMLSEGTTASFLGESCARGAISQVRVADDEIPLDGELDGHMNRYAVAMMASAANKKQLGNLLERMK